MNTKRLKRLALLFSVAALCAASDEPVLDWPRNPAVPIGTACTNETNLPEKWSLVGQNLAWKAP